ncbi:MAG: membrane protein insertase YidC [Gammaproteobacteria bacterium]|nr:membrane protein insertase YidC [Gammaproteobacteria bacterium]
MNNIKSTLWALLFSLVIILWFKWDAANAPKQPVVSQQTQTQSDGTAQNVPAGASGVTTSQTLPTNKAKATHSGELITVKTDVLELTIDTQGGTIVESKLLQYPASITDKTPIKLFDSTPEKLFQLESGLNSNHSNNATHIAKFVADKKQYELTGDTVSVPMTWSENGVTVTKTFTFYKGRYDFDIAQQVDNQSDKDWTGYQYRQLKRAEVVVKRGMTTFNTFAGAAFSTPDKKYERLQFSDMFDYQKDANQALNTGSQSACNPYYCLSQGVPDGWEAMIQHYFMGALISNATDKDDFYTGYSDFYTIGMSGQAKTVPVGQNATFNAKAFVGPKVASNLESIAPNLGKATDYGPFFFISEFLFKVLNWVHLVLGNWGWAIVIVTLGIKTLLFPLAAKSFKSMAKMRKFQPEMERIREQCGEDRQLQGQKMMALYKKEGINPASGCLPIIVQIPIFLAFYYMLMESVELRQAPWIFWIKDLSLKDPLYILPVINMGLMFIQQRLNPPPADPMQRKVMMFLPLMFGVFFLFFPSGLVLYWAVSNLFSIIQQYVITKRYGGLAHPLSHEEEKKK